MPLSSVFGRCASPNTPLFHLASVGLNFNTIRYAIECKVGLVFRADASSSPARLRLRLDPLVPDETQAGASAIELVLHGRWVEHLSRLARNAIVRVEGALVTPAADTDINTCEIELRDDAAARLRARVFYAPPPGTHDGGDGIFKALLGRSLVQCDALVPASIALLLPPRVRKKKASGGRVRGRKHVYEESIAQFHAKFEENVALVAKKEVNLYGVIIEARAPSFTKGTCLRSEVVIADMSSASVKGGVQNFRTLVLHRFEGDPAHALPYRAVGDVIRAHRVQVSVYTNHHRGTSDLQIAGKHYSTYCLWAGDSDSSFPIATVDPVRSKSTKPPEHTIVESDIKIVNELRQWGKAYLKAATAVPRRYLHTVATLRRAVVDGSFANPIDLVCCYEGQPAGAVGTVFTISDGFPLPTDGLSFGNTLTVRGLDAQKVPAQTPVPFERFSLPWKLKPDVIPSWLLIRDARYELGSNGAWEISLKVSDKACTLLWLPPDAAEVRLAKDRGASNTARGSVPSTGKKAAASPSGVATSGSRHTQGTRLHIIQPSFSQLEAKMDEVVNGEGGDAPSPARIRAPAAAPAASTLVLEKKLSGKRAASTQEGIQLTPAKRNRTSAILTEFVSPKDTPLAKDATQFNCVTRNANADQVAVKLSVVRQAALGMPHGTISAFRVQCHICGLKSPRDLTFSCRPWCRSCSSFWKDSPSRCDRCESSEAWAFDIAVILVDADGCMMDAWISGSEGLAFFNGVEPMDFRLSSSAESLEKLHSCLSRMLDQKSLVDCSVQPYSYIDPASGLARVSCKVFATTLCLVSASPV